MIFNCNSSRIRVKYSQCYVYITCTCVLCFLHRATTASRRSWHYCTGWRCQNASSLSWLFWYTDAYTRQLRRTLLRNSISHLLTRLVSVSAVRSAWTSSLVVRSTRLSTIGDRAFPVAAARLWNILPLNVTSARHRQYLFSENILRPIYSDIFFLNFL